MTEDFYFAETRPIDYDDKIDKAVEECLNLGSGKAFLTFAGAGSGKTYSLKKALDYLKQEYSNDFLRHGKQVAVVTYTNNAADEIIDRIKQNPIFAVSTIHSFCWTSIAGFNEDIRRWYLEKIPKDIEDLEDKERKGRAGKASDARKRDIIRLKKKMEWLSQPQSFVYDPNDVNSSQNALSHADVLKIFSSLLLKKPMMAQIIVNKYPFVFIDESQDTNKDVVNAFFELQKVQSDKVVIGLFGDTMQRIFGGGEPELGKTKPNKWLSFDKEMNHRSARRIVGLGNQIRDEVDKRKQYARDGAIDGCIRYFLLPQGIKNKESIELKIREKMAQITEDIGWIDSKSNETAILLLEHKMVGPLLGIKSLWETLSKSGRIKDGIAEGKITELNFFSNIVFPLVDASLNDRKAEVMCILKANKSPLLEEYVLKQNKEDPLLEARTAEHKLKRLFLKEHVSFGDVLELIAENNLLIIPQKLMSFVTGSVDKKTESEFDSEVTKVEDVPEKVDDSKKDNSEIDAWSEALETDFFQIKNYKNYIDENSPYRTHQGVKGNEFERVMVVMDDDEAGGFSFSFEQYFGVKNLSKGSQKKYDAGEETSLDRTRRLFYVTSTRAKSSLAHVIYTSDVTKVRECLLEKHFARECEIIEIMNQ